MSNEKFTPTETIVAQLCHNDRERELCAELVSREAIAKERADAWTALRAVEPFFREDMPDGPDGQRGCATPEYRNAYRLVLAALKDCETLVENLKAATARTKTMTSEAEDNLRLRRASEALAYYREAENQVRRDLAGAVEQTKRAKEKYEAMFAECEARAVARRKASSTAT